MVTRELAKIHFFDFDLPGFSGLNKQELLS